MLKFLGPVDHALFDTITHFSHGECHQCHFPHVFFFFFWGIGAAQVRVVTQAASGRLHSLRESRGGGGLPCLPFSVQMFLC